MLRIYVEDYCDDMNKKDYIHDIEREFLSISLPVTEQTKQIVHDIEGGELLSKRAYKSKFGIVLGTECLSTGCKGALLVHLLPTKIINFHGVGDNVRDYVINKLRDGRIYVPQFMSLVCYNNSDNCDAGIHGFNYRFLSIADLNYYVDNNMGIEKFSFEDSAGVEVLSNKVD